MAKKDRGWIKLHRQIWDSQIWDTNEPFDLRSAWIDLLLMVNHEDRTIIVDGHAKVIEQGQRWTSVRTLAKRWHWSKDRVMRQLNLLKELGMITMSKTQSGTLLTVVKYSYFQYQCDTNKDTDKDTNKDTGKDAGKDETRTIEELKKNEEVYTRARTALTTGEGERQ